MFEGVVDAGVADRDGVVGAFPAVAEAAVISVEHPKWAERPLAAVVLKPGASVEAAELVEFCRGKLAGYKRPRSVDFMDKLPRNASGKTQRHLLPDAVRGATVIAIERDS